MAVAATTADRGEYRQATGAAAMNELLQFIIVVGFGALCFGCGYLTGFIVTRNRWREMIKHGVARYNSQWIVANIVKLPELLRKP
jgi:hypothetical protein